MNILTISASPRKGGNSDTLCDRFMEGAQAAGHTCEKARVAEKNIAPCKACYGCTKTHRCVLKDDMNELMDKAVAADCIVLATPVYFYSVSAQMKLFIDRCYARFRDMEGKRFILLVTAADPDHEDMQTALNTMRGLIRCIPSAQEIGVIYGTSAWEKGDVERLPVMQTAYDMGLHLTD